jgi:PIN domain nuclease of toxin-antitoxin system
MRVLQKGLSGPDVTEYADVQAGLPLHHRDLFDRMLIAQAMVEQIPIVSGDTAFDAYPVQRLW